jgi:hypothetical protein
MEVKFNVFFTNFIASRQSLAISPAQETLRLFAKP